MLSTSRGGLRIPSLMSLLLKGIAEMAIAEEQTYWVADGRSLCQHREAGRAEGLAGSKLAAGEEAGRGAMQSRRLG